MSKAEERMEVLNMLQQGKINPDEASALIETIEKSYDRSPSSDDSDTLSPAPGKGRWMRVRVTDNDTGKLRVNVRLPLALVSSGIRFGLKFAPDVQGLDIDELSDWIRNGTIGQIVDVIDEEDGEHIEVFIE